MIPVPSRVPVKSAIFLLGVPASDHLIMLGEWLD